MSAVVSISGIAQSAYAQAIEPVDPQDRAVRIEPPARDEQLIRSVRDRLSAEFLTDQERASLRVVHGQWIEDDLDDPKLLAQIALDLNDLDHPIFDDPDAPIELQAQAHLEQGLAQEALDLIEQAPTETIKTLYIRALAQEMLGNFDQAIEGLERIESLLSERRLDDADELAIGSSALIKLTRLRSPAVSARADYEAINALISLARDRVDRLNWRVRAVEAHLLYEHHNLGDAHAAATEALRLNPRAADPLLLLGHIAVDGFDFDTAERIADQLDQFGSALDTAQEDSAPAVSIGGAILRARIALRRRDPVDAERSLDPAMDLYPTHPMLLALEASAAAGGYRMSSTNRLLNRFDEQFPGSPTAAVWVGRTLSEARQYSYAAEILRRAVELAPNWGEPRLQLGQMLVQAGKDDEAHEALTQAMSLDPFNLRAQNSLTLLNELATYDTIETEHFIIRYKPGPDEVLAREMPPILEAIHERVCADVPGGMNHEPDQKTIIELMPNHEWFAVRIGGMPSIHTMAASTGPVIAFESPREGAKSSAGEYDWVRVLQHEYTHTVNLSRTQNRVIHWMTEANAVFNEDAPRDQNQWNLLVNAFRTGGLFDLEEINIAFVRPEKPTDRPLAYAQGAWMFEYLIEVYGPDAPRLIMDESTSGRSAPEAFEEVLGLGPDQFMDGFMRWAISDLRDHGLLAGDGVPSLDELLDDPRKGLPSRATLDELLGKYPDHPDLISLRVGLTLSSMDDRLNEDTIALLEEAIRVRPVDEMPHKRLARHYLASESFDERIKSIEHLEFLDAREVMTSVYADQLAELYAQLGDFENALKKAIRSTQIAPFDARAREQAARMALLNERAEIAVTQLNALIEIEPTRDIHKQRLGALRSMLNEPEED
ncbi:MAG: hypothetical protein JJ974_05700 [Phycisphaerales bacterium]|nr:hypothetical protein [Phycisphaerales bacterium]